MVEEGFKLQNSEFLKDMLCSNPRFVVGIMKDILGEMGAPLKDPVELEESLGNCGCVQTEEGLEWCLLQNREEISRIFEGGGQSPKYEEFLKKLDEELDAIKTDSSKHLL